MTALALGIQLTALVSGQAALALVFPEPQCFIWKKRVIPFTSVATMDKGSVDGHVAELWSVRQMAQGRTTKTSRTSGGSHKQAQGGSAHYLHGSWQAPRCHP